ncbi:aldo/keto reductase [Spirillospora sp. NPDC048823]|uniref:aldo/keto reductase n=1 Tax=unclassified Spirillospora TaxID=2642701 RepID=UPI0037144A33
MRAGKIRTFGCSTYPAFEIVESHRVAEQRGLMRFRTEQPPYNLLARGAERDVLPVAERESMGVLTWSPLAFGFLTGHHRKNGPVRAQGRTAIRPEWFDRADPVTARTEDQRPMNRPASTARRVSSSWALPCLRFSSPSLRGTAPSR